MTTYENYKKIRDLKGLKDSNIANLTGIAKSTLSDWKSGKSQPKTDKLKRIAEVLDVSIESFYGSENYQKDNSTNTWEYVISTEDMQLFIDVMSEKDSAGRLIAYAKKLLELKNMEDV